MYFGNRTRKQNILFGSNRVSQIFSSQFKENFYFYLTLTIKSQIKNHNNEKHFYKTFRHVRTLTRCLKYENCFCGGNVTDSPMKNGGCAGKGLHISVL
jgi:hypothetical protein